MKHFKLLVVLLFGALFLFTACPTPESTDVATLTIQNSSGNENITVHFGDYNETTFQDSTSMASTGEIKRDSTITFLDCPLNKAVNIWYTYTTVEDEAENNYIIKFVTGSLKEIFEQTFEAGETYQLIINEGTFELIHDGINLAGTDTGTDTTAPDTGNDEGTNTDTDTTEPDTTEPDTTEADVTDPVVTINLLDTLDDNDVTYYSPLSYELLVTENSKEISPTKGISTTNGKIRYVFKDTSYKGDGERYKFTVVPDKTGLVKVTLAAGTFSDLAGNKNIFTTCSKTIQYKSMGLISEIASTSDPKWVYAVDYDFKQMLLIDVENEKIDSVIELPYPNPVSIKFSKLDKYLYIAYEYKHVISRYNLNTKSFIDELDYDPNGTLHTLEIDIAPVSNKIYCLSPDDSYNSYKYDGFLTIISLDKADVLASGNVEGTLLAVTDSESTNKIFIGTKGSNPATLRQYIQKNEQIVFDSDKETIQEQKQECEISGGGNGKYLVVSPDNKHLIFATGAGNGDGYNMHDFDTSRITTHNGKWNCGAYPIYAAFSADSKYIYSWGEEFYKFDNNYNNLGILNIPHQNDAIFTLNSDDSKLIAFSYKKDEYRFYFYSSIRP